MDHKPWEEITTEELLKPEKKRNWPKIIGIGFMVLLVSGCMTSYFLMQSLHADDIPHVLDTFAASMRDRDYDTAYQLISREAKKVFSFEALENQGGGANYAIWDQFDHLEVLSSQVGWNFNIYGLSFESSNANMNGQVTYSNGFVGSFNATLQRDDGVWKIYFFEVIVPPEKNEEFQSN